MKLVELNAEMRTKTGNGPNRTLRNDGKLPAIMYGVGIEPMMLSVDMLEMEKAIKTAKGSQLFMNITVKKDGNDIAYPVMLKEMVYNPMRTKMVHADFLLISDDRKIKTVVPVTTKGLAVGVDNGGLLQLVRRELEIVSYPKDLPEIIELDVTNLNIGDAIHVEDIALGDDVEISHLVNFTVVSVIGKKRTAGEGEEAEAEAEA